MTIYCGMALHCCPLRCGRQSQLPISRSKTSIYFQTKIDVRRT